MESSVLNPSGSFMKTSALTSLLMNMFGISPSLAFPPGREDEVEYDANSFVSGYWGEGVEEINSMFLEETVEAKSGFLLSVVLDFHFPYRIMDCCIFRKIGSWYEFPGVERCQGFVFLFDWSFPFVPEFAQSRLTEGFWSGFRVRIFVLDFHNECLDGFASLLPLSILFLISWLLSFLIEFVRPDTV